MAQSTSNEPPKPACLPESGKLPPALLNPNSIVILRAFTAIDQIESGIRMGDAAVVQHGQREVAKVVSHVRQKLCRAYRYPDPEQDAPQVWQVLCTSGKDGEFLASPLDCANCHLFNTSFRTTPSALPVRTIAEVLAMEAQHA